MRTTIAFLALCLATAAADETAVRVEREHYVLFAQAPADVAEEYADVLEAAWWRFREFFDAEPKLPEDGKLVVRLLATKEAFVAALRADGQPVPDSGGYYSPANRTAYLWRQPTRYYSRCLLIHEAAHQFHFLSRTGNRSVPCGWYVEGLAEYLCRHRWDGKRLDLGRLPLVSLKDYAAAAAGELAAGADLGAQIGADRLSRPLSWALVRYLLDGANASRFRRLMDRFDRGGPSAALLYRTFGSPKKLAARLTEWIAAEQEPWSQVFNQWEEIAPGAVRGESGPNVVSFCRPKAAATRISATFRPPEGPEWTAGLLLARDGPDDYTVGIVFHGKIVRVNRRKDGKWTPLASAKCPAPGPDGAYRLAAARDGGKVRFSIGDTEIGAFELPGEQLGLALQGGVVVFRKVAWE